ncbi:30S ribosomal protein S6e [Candidatus Pacearchaeota archaeon]|nr:30S ribosomal protein S6e [Candidatus Pacearchaeota archaeon]
MAFKLNISDKGKAWKIESEARGLAGKSVGESVHGKEINHDLEGYEFEITGGSDIAGFPLAKNVEGIGLKRILFSRGFGMRENGKGLRRRKTVRGKTIAETTVQINMKVMKHGNKKLAEIFPEQNKGKAEKKAEHKKE